MRRWRTSTGLRMGLGVFLMCWAMAAAIALGLGPDANWDLRNYHYYNAYAVIEGRWHVDLAPAGAHTFLHPGLDLPFYLMTQGPLNHWPRLVSVAQAGYLGLLAFLVLALANLVCHNEPARASGASVLVAAFGLTGAATLPEAGTTLNDIQVGCMVVGALLSLLLASRAEALGHHWHATRLHLLAGLLGGAAVGLKLTAVVYLPALGFAAIVAGGSDAARRMHALVLLGIGCAAGFMAVYGPWGWFLFERFGNPFGPFFNQVFHSPWFPLDSGRDRRFLPSGLWQALAYPLLWARRSEGLVTESPLADPRFAIGLAALLIATGSAIWKRLAGRRGKWPLGAKGKDAPSDSAIARRAEWAVMAFILASYSAWLVTFSILRYAVPIEALLGVPVWAAARRLLVLLPSVRHGPQAEPARERPPGGIAPAWTTAIALGVCALVTLYPNWGRQPVAGTRQPHGNVMMAVESIRLPEGSLVAMVGPAVSITAPFLARPGVRFIGVPHPGEVGAAAFRTGMAEQVRDIVRANQGPMFAVVEDPDNYDREVAKAYGIELDLSSCVELPNNLTTSVRLCGCR